MQWLQKKKDRESVIQKSKKPSLKQKDKFLHIIFNDFMSSEESQDHDLDIHSLPWRSKLVDFMFQKINENITLNHSSRSKRQKKTRKTSQPPSHPCPSSTQEWAVGN